MWALSCSSSSSSVWPLLGLGNVSRSRQHVEGRRTGHHQGAERYGSQKKQPCFSARSSGSCCCAALQSAAGQSRRRGGPDRRGEEGVYECSQRQPWSGEFEAGQKAISMCFPTVLREMSGAEAGLAGDDVSRGRGGVSGSTRRIRAGEASRVATGIRSSVGVQSTEPVNTSVSLQVNDLYSSSEASILSRIVQ